MVSKNKENTARSYAEQGLEDVQEELAAVETLPEEDEFKQVGGLEKVDRYYRFTEAKKEGTTPQTVMQPGDELQGTYVKNFIAGKFKKPTFLIRTSNGELAGIGGAGSLEKSMLKVAEGAKVKIIYDGKSVIKGGQWEGSEAHNFRVFASKTK